MRLLTSITLLLSALAGIAQASKNFKIASWNVGLFPYYPLTQVDTVISKIPTDPDFIHLQEVWSADHASRVINALKDTYKYSYYIPADVGSAGVCAGSLQPQVNALLQCAAANGLAQFSNLEALFAACGTQVIQLITADVTLTGGTSAPCTSCLATIGGYVTPFFPNGVQNCFLGQGYQFVFGGSYGQLLLSKKKFEDVEVHKFGSFLGQRASLSVTINDVRFAFVHMPNAYLSLPFEDLQLAQAQFLNAQKPDFIIGDFNSGPDYQSDAWNFLTANNWVSAVGTAEPTFCPDLTYPICVGQTKQTIDHIFYNTNNPDLTFRVLTGKTRYFNTGANQVSDHIGVFAHVKVDERN